LYDSIEVLEVLPYEASNARILRDGLEGIIRLTILGARFFDYDIVDVEDGDVGDFRLKDVGDIIVEYRD
jgi:hypothetical protein